ncbi:MAG: DNA circularization N-terminal domain-containing protein [Rhodospirillales bacterium]|nr:DNA circularization N-terminal domain-containing protein [Rhodospirillales bacterium]
MTAASWRAGLRPASFRGVPFHVREADVGRGRRIAVHQYPGRDEPYAEDLGRAARTYTITAFVLPPDPLARAARLADALEAPGAGTLVLPWRTDAQVVCTGAAERYETQAGGLVVFTLQFTEAGERRYPARRVGDAAAVDRSASAAGAAAGAAFAAMFVARTGVTGDEAGRHWQHIITTIRDVVGPYARPAADGMAWGLRIQRASAAAADLIAAPDRIPAHLGALMGVPLAAGAGIAAFRRLIDYDADAPPIVGAGTAARQLTANRDAMVAVTRAIAIAGGGAGHRDRDI